MRRRSRAGGEHIKTRLRKTVTRKRQNAPKVEHRRSASIASLEVNVTRLTRELDEAREQQAATAEVLKLISRSTFDLKTVLNTLAESAAQLCAAEKGLIFQRDGDVLRLVANLGYSREAERYWLEHPLPVDGGSATGRAVLEGRAIHIPDVLADPEYRAVRHQEVAGYRTALSVPLLRDGTTIGTFSLTRDEVNPFTDKQIELVTTFADQAVIAIENTRLFEAEQQRTRELTESLTQQTATADVLKVISRSAFDLRTVLDTLTESAARLCAADKGNIFQRDGDLYQLAANYGFSPEAEQYGAEHPVRLDRGSVTGRVALEGTAIHIPDVLVDPEYRATGYQAVFGYRTVLGVPLLREGTTIGVFTLTRDEVNPFTEKQIELVTTFADQAVIAIENARLLNELRESLQQQTATADVLKVISRSQFDLQLVLDNLIKTATDLCGAKRGVIFRREGDLYRGAAFYNATRELIEFVKAHPIAPGRHTITARVALERRVVHVADLQADPEYTYALRDTEPIRTELGVPMFRGEDLIGVVILYKLKVEPFTDKQIELVTTFADQAVIAIENARLLNELRESLRRQTATADVLKVISRSTFDLRSVLETLTESAVRLCSADNGAIFQRDGDLYRFSAQCGFSPEAVQYALEHPLGPSSNSLTGRVALQGRAVHIPDVLADPEYRMTEYQEVFGYRTNLGVPLLREGSTIGVFSLTREEVKPFTEEQIELVTTFADQAVIAIENARLLNELRQRTDDLSESLEQQTATSEILEVISNSPTNTQPAFDAIVRSGLNLFPDAVVAISLPDRDLVKLAAIGGADEAGLEALRGRYPMPLSHEFITGTAILDRREIDLADAHEPPKELTVGAQNLLAGGYCAMTVMPMMRGDETMGALNVIRRHRGPLSDKQRELLRTFANQAVIAIENTRLFNELRESLQQQTATADVLKVISRSTFDLQTVLQTLVESAARLCDADKTIITRQKNGVFYRAEAYGFSREFIDYVRNIPIQPERGSGFGRALLEGRAVHIPDVKADPEYTLVEGQRLGDYRTALAVPMLREGVPTGVLSLTRSEVRPFTEKQIELASTFADQAAIAIENVRLFESVEARTRELAKSLEDLRTAQDRLVQTEKLASLGQLTAGIAHEIKNPLNFVNNFSAVSVELIDELREALGGAHFDSKLRGEISEIADTLQGNLGKVVQHGKRADAIVKNMLLHSRQGSGEHRPVDINALVDESLNLAYHGARAEKQGFNITLERSFDPAAGEVDLFPQEITRALLNLINNGFYATTKRKAEANGGDYEPTLAATTKNLGDSVEIRIRDNGTGIPPEVREKLFNPFFTTKPAGEGTGLGLSISHDIIVKQHGGSIEVDTEPGAFTEFRIVLPRTGASLIKSGERL